MMYNKVVMDHFRNPRNVGTIEGADGIGEVGNPLCGDMMTIYLKIQEERIDRHQVPDLRLRFGHRRVQHADRDRQGQEPGRRPRRSPTRTWPMPWKDLPKNKLHCSNLGADALQLAIKDYEDRKAGIQRPEPKRKDEHEHSHGDKCYCPYCDVEIEGGVTFCEACQHDLKEEH